jgi:two-component system sensor histidine kinase MprB
VLTAPGALDAPGGGRQVVVEVLDGQRRIVARSLTLGARLLPRDRTVTRALDGRAGFGDLQLGGRPLRLYAAPLPASGGAAAGGAVLVGSDTSDIERTLSHLRLLLLLAALAAAGLASLAAALLTRRGLRPLRQLSHAAREIERVPDAGRRMPPATTDDEIGQLTEVLNGMLAALDRARDNERRFLADASHELRTPVTSLLGNVEYASRHGADADLLAELRLDAARLGRLVDDLLTLERSGPPARLPVSLDVLVREAAAAQPRVELGRVDPAVAEGDEDALRRALGNLIENALVHGPPGAPVSVSLTFEADSAAITVRDEGDGPAERDREHLFERFWRGPAATGRPGSGLGLPIAASIVAGHGGRISVEGAVFTVELPARASSIPRQPMYHGGDAE